MIGVSFLSFGHFTASFGLHLSIVSACLTGRELGKAGLAGLLHGSETAEDTWSFAICLHRGHHFTSLHHLLRQQDRFWPGFFWLSVHLRRSYSFIGLAHMEWRYHIGRAWLDHILLSRRYVVLGLFACMAAICSGIPFSRFFHREFPLGHGLFRIAFYAPRHHGSWAISCPYCIPFSLAFTGLPLRFCFCNIYLVRWRFAHVPQQFKSVPFWQYREEPP